MEPTNDTAPHAIDLGAHQRAIIAALQQDQQRLAELDNERAAVLARIHANRGKLDLIAELSQQAAVVTTSDEAARG